MQPLPYDNAGYFLLLQQGDERALNHFFHLYYPPIYSYCRLRLSDPEAAGEVAGDCFLRLWQNRTIIQSEAGLKSWLYSTARNACIDRQRKHRPVQQLDTDEHAHPAAPEVSHLEAMIRAEMVEHLHQAIRQLPSQCANIFRKLFIEGKEMATVAKELSLSINTIKSQRARGLRLLRERLVILLPIIFLRFL